MSVNVYFNEKVRELPGCKSVPYADGSGNTITLDGISLFSKNGRMFAMWSENAPIPENLKNLVEEVSYHEAIAQMGHRESGIYRYRSATCELMPRDDGNAERKKLLYVLKITARNMEDVRELMHMVKTGMIRPDESYEGLQSGKSHAELEVEVDLWKATSRGLQQNFVVAQDKVTRVEGYLTELISSESTWPWNWWPLVIRTGVIQRLNAILDNTK